VCDRGLLQGSVISPQLFCVFLQCLMENYVASGIVPIRLRSATRILNPFPWPPPASNEELLIWWLAYADDVILIAESRQELSTCIERFAATCKSFGMQLACDKTVFTILGAGAKLPDDAHDIKLSDGNTICYYDHLNYLGCYIDKDGGDAKHVERRLILARSTAARYSGIIRCRNLSSRLRCRFIRAVSLPSALFGIESCCMSTKMLSKLRRFERWSLHTALHIDPSSHVTTASMRQMAGQTSSLTEMAISKRLNFAGHLARHQNLLCYRTLCARLARKHGRFKKGRCSSWLKTTSIDF
jgi:hypothetical protein